MLIVEADPARLLTHLSKTSIPVEPKMGQPPGTMRRA
jgi:hypothetical protein